MDEAKKYYTLKEVAQTLGITYNYLVNNIVKNGLINTMNVGAGKRTEHRVSADALQEYLSRNNPNQNTIQAAVAELQKIRNSIVISYITNQLNPIQPDDALFFADVIEDVFKKKNIQSKVPKIDIFINSFGGSLDTAYKISRLLWKYADEVNSIVPIYAKSAAAAICVGTREITMSRVAELGPVDPIISNPFTKETFPAKSIKIFLSYQSDKVRLSADKIDPQIIGKIGDKLKPHEVGNYINMLHASKEYLEILLKNYMFVNAGKSDDQIGKIIDNLTEKHSSHAFVIDQDEAKDIGLNTRLATLDEEGAIKKLTARYFQYMKAQGITKLVGNEFWQIQQVANKVEDVKKE